MRIWARVDVDLAKIRQAPSLFPNDAPHRISGICDHFFDLRVAEGFPRLGRNGDEFFGQIDVDGGDLWLLSKCLFDSGRAKGANHAVDRGRDCFRECRAR